MSGLPEIWTEVARAGTVRGRLRIVVCAALCLVVGFAVAQEDSPEPEPAPAPVAPPARDAIPYEVTFTGAPPALLSGLRTASGLLALQSRPPASMVLLERRAALDADTLTEVLHAEGYFATEIQTDIATDRRPALVTLRITPGPVYRVDSVEVDFGGADAGTPPSGAMAIRPGGPARAADIVQTGNALVRHLQRYGYPYPSGSKPQLAVDHEARTVAVTFYVAPGEKARFGATALEGLSGVHEAYIRRKLPWQEQDPFSLDLLEQARQALVDTGLFAMVRVAVDGPVADDGTVPILVDLSERPHRTIGGSLQYKTDEGAGVSGMWEHRNFRGAGQRLHLEARLAQNVQGFEASYAIPDRHALGRTLTYSGRLGRDDLEAYESTGMSAGAEVAWQVNDVFSFGYGLRASASRVKHLDETNAYYVVSAPAFIRVDTTDEPSDPSKGARVRLEGSLNAPFGKSSTPYLRGAMSYAHFVRLSRRPSLILAARVHMGTILGADRDEVPPQERFFAGGGGSVRGYGFQLVGPLDRDDKPIGGRSLFETSVELRWRITETIGMVAFVDGGVVDDGLFPGASGRMRWAAGLGARYFSIVGPLRLDVAFPLDRTGVDDAFQLYASLGHAF